MKSHRAQQLPVVLTIAGSDSGAGAGIQADLLTFSALGVFGTTAITCLTAQNPDEVSQVHEVPPDMVREQIYRVAAFFRLRALKTGMLFSAPIIREVAAFLRANKRIKAVVDPVMVSSSGARLLRKDAISAMQADLVPLAALVTPNLDEAAVMLDHRPGNRGELIDAASVLADQFGVPVLLKGGHLDGAELIDVLARPRRLPVVFTGRRIHEVDTHGSGCTLSAAVAALLARGKKLEDAVAGARQYLRRGMTHPAHIGKRRFIAHR